MPLNTPSFDHEMPAGTSRAKLLALLAPFALAGCGTPETKETSESTDVFSVQDAVEAYGEGMTVADLSDPKKAETLIVQMEQEALTRGRAQYKVKKQAAITETVPEYELTPLNDQRDNIFDYLKQINVIHEANAQWKLKMYGDDDGCGEAEDCMAVWTYMDFVDETVTDRDRKDYIPL